MVEVTAKPVPYSITLACVPVAPRLSGGYAEGVFRLAIASGILFVFFNERVFSSEYDLTPASGAR
ncbi:hypothetical protein [Paraburkholderia lacunae]|uniref:hypothetical protein n=1 Tax=Paraburkholderia lacunae TaxID=2211104 RepID=UPI001058BEFC|nr:hypothetical protein [Paraburkholderia lacunae]